MAPTQAEADALRAAIYSGVKSVTTTFNGRTNTTTYQNLDEMRAALALLESELAALIDPAPARAPRQHLAFQAGSGF